MVDRLQNVAAAISNVSILPVERNTVIGAVLVPETQRRAGRHWPELLIEGTVSQRLVIVLLAMGILLRVAACKCLIVSGVWAISPDYRIVVVAINDPGRERASLESAVLDHSGIADASIIVILPCKGHARIASISCDGSGANYRLQLA